MLELCILAGGSGGQSSWKTENGWTEEIRLDVCSQVVLDGRLVKGPRTCASKKYEAISL